MFNKLADERLEEITKLDKKVNPYDLICNIKVPLLMENLMNLIMLLILYIK